MDYIISKFHDSHFYRVNVDMLNYYNIIIKNYGWEIKSTEWEISSKTIDSIYYRKPRLPDLFEYEEQYINMIQKDVIALIEGMVNSFEKYVLSKPHILHCCENKVYQLQQAQKVGFLVPNSTITNDLVFAQSFLTESNIIKPLTTGKIIYNDNIEFFQTNLIKEIEQDISLTPIYLQNYVTKKFEVRATFVSKKVFGVKIISSNHIDWRDENAINNYEPITLPQAIYDKCIKLMNIFKIDFGAFDFIVDDNDDWVFLEVNPNGQWLWLENELNLNISQQIINLLEGDVL